MTGKEVAEWLALWESQTEGLGFRIISLKVEEVREDAWRIVVEVEEWDGLS